VDDDGVARLGAFDIERTRQRIASGRDLLIAKILAALINGLGGDYFTRFDAVKNRIGMGKRPVVLCGNNRFRLGGERSRGEHSSSQQAKHALSCHGGRRMAISIVRLGTKRTRDEGLRIGTVRRPPRGVAKADFARLDYYDVWLPILSPSPELVSFALNATDAKQWATFGRRYRSEMNRSDASRTLDLLAALSQQTNFSVGCYCEDENRCHRSILKSLLLERSAQLS